MGKWDEYKRTENIQILNKFEGSPFLPKEQKVEQMISERPDSVQRLVQELSDPYTMQRLKQHPFGTIMKPLVTAAKIGAVPFQRGEAALASAGLATQKAENPLEVFKAGWRGLSGQRPAELGDVIRTTEVGGRYNELLASATGLLSAIGLTNLITKGSLSSGVNKIKDSISKFRETRNLKKQFFYKNRADELNSGIDEVFTSIRQEADNLYNKIGGNVLSPDNQVITQDITVRLPESILNKLRKITDVKGIPNLTTKKTRTILEPTINTAKKIKTEIGKFIPKNVWNGIEDANEMQAKLIDDYFNLNKVIAESAGELKPDLLSLNDKFHDLFRYNRIIKGLTQTSQGVTKTGIRNIKQPSMQGILSELQQFGKDYFPKVNDIIKDINKFNKMESRMKTIGKTAKWATVGGVGYGLSRKFITNPVINAIESISGGGTEGEGY